MSYGLGRSKILLYLGSILLVASGCQSNLIVKSSGMDNAGFMSLWDSYSHCKITSNINDVGTDVHRLAEAAQSRYAYANEGFALPLPKGLARLINTPTNRYAVDVRAMASACSLHAGQLALDHGQWNLAREMFGSVISFHSNEESSYYLTRAKTQLSEMERGVDLSLKTP